MKINKINILFVILTIILVSCGNPTDPQDLSTQKLKSETKWFCNPTTKEKLYKLSYNEYSLDGKLIKSIIYNDLGNKISDSEISYSENKSVETESFYDKTGIIDSVKITTSTFDDKGKKISSLESSVKGDTLLYNEFTYDLNGNLVEKIEQSGKNSKVFIYKITYNEKGQLLERSTDITSSGIILTKETYNYIPEINKIEKIISDEYGVIININSYYFNTTGKIMIESISDNTGKVFKYFIYEYIYY